MVYYYSSQIPVFGYSEKITIVNLQEAIEIIKSFESNIIQYDCETTGLDPHTKNLITMQFGSINKEKQVVIDCRGFKEEYNLLKDILETKILLGHNLKFDVQFLFKHNIFPSNIMDTQIAEMCLKCGLDSSVSLQNVSFNYLNLFLDKSVRSNFTNTSNPLTEKEIIYAAKDVTYLYDILQEQFKIQYKGFGKVFKLECAAVLPLASVEYNGMKIDVIKWQEVTEENKKSLQKVKGELDKIVMGDVIFKSFWPSGTQTDLFKAVETTPNINYNSSAQKLKLLKCISKDIEDTGDRTLQKNKHKHKFIKKLIEYNGLSKLVSSFGAKFTTFINPVTKRVHQDIWQILDTHRMSSKNPNLTQIPSKGDMGKRIRSAFISEEGWSIVGGDFSQCELRLIAEFSQDPTWLEAFNAKKDLHSILAMMTFEISEDQVKSPSHFKPDLTYRDIQKRINFGLAYGMTEYKLSDEAEISVNQAKQIIVSYFNKVPKVKQFLESNAKFAMQNGYIQTPAPFSIRRQFPDWELAIEHGDNKVLEGIGRQGKNTPIQGSNAMLTKLALVMLYNESKKVNYPVKIINIIHDEILTEVPDEHAENWKEIMHNTMIKAGSYFVKTLTMESDCKISKFWQK